MLLNQVSQILASSSGISVIVNSQELDWEKMAEAELYLIATESEINHLQYVDDLRGNLEFCLSPIILLALKEPKGICFPYYGYTLTWPFSESAFKKAIKFLGPTLTWVRNSHPLPEVLEEGFIEAVSLEFERENAGQGAFSRFGPK